MEFKKWLQEQISPEQQKAIEDSRNHPSRPAVYDDRRTSGYMKKLKKV